MTPPGGAQVPEGRPEGPKTDGGDSSSQGRTPAGKRPGPLKQFWWDLLPKKSPDWLVPRRSGLEPPDVCVEWITVDIADHPEALAQTRRAHDLELDRVTSLESKASGMVTLCLTLLATALAIAGYEVGFLRDEQDSRWWLLTPAVLSLAFLALAAITSLEVQRVGVYQWEGAEPLGREPGSFLGLVESEERGRRLAGWSAGIKADGFLQARAWLSRALVALIVSVFVAIGMATRPASDTQKPSGTEAPTAATR